MLQDAATAAAFAEAGEHETARSITTAARQTRKILVIGNGESFSQELSRYALDMAKRLDFELVALNVTSAPLDLTGAAREEAIATFKTQAANNIAAMQAEAASGGIAFTHKIEIAEQDNAVEKLHAENAGLRYVLTEPDPEMMKKADNKVSIPVFDLASYQSLAA